MAALLTSIYLEIRPQRSTCVDNADGDGHRPIPTSCCFYLAFYLSEFSSVMFSICKRTERWEGEWEWVRNGTWDREGGKGAAASFAWQRRVPLRDKPGSFVASAGI